MIGMVVDTGEEGDEGREDCFSEGNNSSSFGFLGAFVRDRVPPFFLFRE